MQSRAVPCYTSISKEHSQTRDKKTKGAMIVFPCKDCGSLGPFHESAICHDSDGSMDSYVKREPRLIASAQPRRVRAFVIEGGGPWIIVEAKNV